MVAGHICTSAIIFMSFPGPETFVQKIVRKSVFTNVIKMAANFKPPHWTCSTTRLVVSQVLQISQVTWYPTIQKVVSVLLCILSFNLLHIGLNENKAIPPETTPPNNGIILNTDLNIVFPVNIKNTIVIIL
jgi:hypothetical protein